MRGKSWLDQRVVEFLAAAIDAERSADRSALVKAIEERLQLPHGQLTDLSEVPEHTLSVLLTSITATGSPATTAWGEMPGNT